MLMVSRVHISTYKLYTITHIYDLQRNCVTHLNLWLCSVCFSIPVFVLDQSWRRMLWKRQLCWSTRASKYMNIRMYFYWVRECFLFIIIVMISMPAVRVIYSAPNECSSSASLPIKIMRRYAVSLLRNIDRILWSSLCR